MYILFTLSKYCLETKLTKFIQVGYSLKFIHHQQAEFNLHKSRLEHLKNVFTYFKDKDTSKISKGQIKTRLDVLKANWLKV